LNFFKIFFVFNIIVNLALAILFTYLGNTLAVYSLESAFLGSLAVIFSTYYGYKKVIESKLQKNNEESLEDDDKEDELDQSKISLVTQSYKGFLFPMRIASYGIFIASFLYLISSETFEVTAFLSGLAIVPTSVLFSMLWLRIISPKEQESSL